MLQYSGSSGRGTLPSNDSTRIRVVEERARELAETAIIIADTDEPIIYDDMTYHGITNLWSLHMQRLSKERFEPPGLSPGEVLRMQPLQRRRHIYLEKLVSFENQLERSRQAMLGVIQELDKNNIGPGGGGSDALGDGGENSSGSGSGILSFASGSERTKFIHDWMEASIYEQRFPPIVNMDDPAYERAKKPHLKLTKEQLHGKYIAPAGRNSSNWLRSDSSGSG